MHPAPLWRVFLDLFFLCAEVLKRSFVNISKSTRHPLHAHVTVSTLPHTGVTNLDLSACIYTLHGRRKAATVDGMRAPR